MRVIKIRGVLIDLDGTLIDSIPLHAWSLREALSRLGVKVKEEDVADEIGMSPFDIIEKIKQKYHQAKNLDVNKVLEIKKKLFFENIDKLKIIGGAYELLEFLKEKRVKTALVTSSQRLYVEKILEKFSLTKYFNSIVTSDDVKRAKPEPDIFVKALNDLNLKPNESIVIEDSVYGIVAAKRVGIPVFAVLTGVNSKSQIKDLHPLKIFKSVYEVYKFLKENNLEIIF